MVAALVAAFHNQALVAREKVRWITAEVATVAILVADSEEDSAASLWGRVILEEDSAVSLWGRATGVAAAAMEHPRMARARGSTRKIARATCSTRKIAAN